MNFVKKREVFVKSASQPRPSLFFLVFLSTRLKKHWTFPNTDAHMGVAVLIFFGANFRKGATLFLFVVGGQRKQSLRSSSSISTEKISGV